MIKPMSDPKLLARALLPLLFLVVAGCEQPTPEAPTTAPEKVAVEVVSTPLREQPWSYTLITYGQLKSADTVSIGADSGGTVEKVSVRDGSTVKRGDELVRLDREKQRFRLTRARANRESIAADLEQAERQLQKFEQVVSAGTVSKDMLEQARTRRNALAARVAQADSEIRIAEKELAERVIISPLDGVVSGDPVDVGERVATGELLLTIQSNDALQVTTWVNQHEVNQVRRGQSAQVQVSTGIDKHLATVESVARSASPTTGNFEVKLRLGDAGGSLREGMSARVEIELKNSSRVIFVPRSAVVDRDRKRVVFLVDGDRAVQRQPRFGLPDNERIPVLQGLQEGDELILEPLSLLTDGSLITRKDDSAE